MESYNDCTQEIQLSEAKRDFFTAKNRNLEQVFFNKVVKNRDELFRPDYLPLEAESVFWAAQVVADYRILERKLAELEIKLSNKLIKPQASQPNRSSGVDISRLKSGSVLRVRGGFGTGAAKTVTLVGVEHEGKNGRDVIEYIDKDGEEHWAYLDQIVSVITY